MAETVTVRKKGKRFTSEFSKLPGRTFGPYELAEMVRDLRVSALLEPLDARNLVLDAAANGEATAEIPEAGCGSGALLDAAREAQALNAPIEVIREP